MDVIARLEPGPGQLRNFEQFASEAAAIAGRPGERFIVASRDRRALALKLPEETGLEKTLSGAAAQDPGVHAMLDGGYAVFLDSIARSRHSGKVDQVAMALADERKRGKPLSSRRILEVAHCLDREVPVPAASRDEHTEAVQGKATGTSSDSGPGEGAATGKKKRKKPRVQEALNRLRREGVEAFKAHVEATITEPGQLHALEMRIDRAQDLQEGRSEALGVVRGRLAALEARAVSRPPRRAGTGRAQAPEVATPAKENTEPNLRVRELVHACKHGHAGRVRGLLRHGNVDINVGAPGSFLCSAAIGGHSGVVRALLSVNELDVNLAWRSGATPLYLAVQERHVEVVKLLLGAPGIKPDLATVQGMTPLYLAAYNGDATLVELLLEAGANANLFQFNDNATPIIAAAERGYDEVVKRLLASPDIDVDWQMKSGATALVMAAQFGFASIVGRLIDRGADVNLMGSLGTTALGIASSFGHLESVERLLRAPGIQVDLRSESEATPLSIAAQEGHGDIVRLLLGAGADPNAARAGGLSPLHFACLHGHAAVVEILADSGIDIDAQVRDKTGRSFTPLDLAALAGHRSLADSLKRLRETRATPSGPSPRMEGLTLRDEPGRAAGKTALPEPTPAPTPAGHLPGANLGTPALPAQQAGPEADPAGKAPDEARSPTREPELSSEVVPAAPPSPLGQAKEGLRQEVLRKLVDDNLESLEGIRLLVDVNSAGDLDSLCVLYNRLAHIERVKERARRQGKRVGESIRRAVATAPSDAPVYALGERTGLDAERLEAEVKRHLDQKYHRFVSQAVNDMEFGRGKPTSGYPGLWHASAGIAGLRSCSLFYYADEESRQLSVAGIGHHVGSATYKLDYASGALADGPKTLSLQHL